MSSTSVKFNDGRVNDRIENYTKFWNADPLKEKETDNAKRLDSYTEVVNGYYDGATELYEYGWSQSFHFSRFYKGEAFLASLARHEHYLAAQMVLRPGMRVLDVGCGVGGPAREIAQFTDARIVGLNNNEFQIGRARRYAKRAGLENQVTFVKGDFMKLSEQFGENSFDAVYAIEATVHAPTWEGVYGEIFKVLKPGGVFGVYEWAMTDAWDPSIPEHKAIAHQIELGNGIPEMRPLKRSREALKTVGFQIEHEEDLADRPDPIPWYYPLEGDISKAQTVWDYMMVWRISWSGKFVSHNAIWLMERFGFLPKGTYDVSESLKVAGESLVKGGQMKLFTPMYLVLTFLRSSLPEFERRSQGSIRGDAKKFALERAQDFIVRFGLPDEFMGVEEPESRFKEQIYNWFKNTVGRTRRKLEGRPRSAKKAAEKAAAALANELAWSSSVATPNVVPYSHPESSSGSPVNPAQTLISPIQYAGLQQPSSSMTNLPASSSTHNLATLSLGISQTTVRESFMQGLDSSTIATMIQSFVAANPSPTPLTPIVDALFEAISSETSPNAFDRDATSYLRRFLDASTYFPTSIVHAGIAGPLAGPRAIQMQIRKYSTWMPTAPPSRTMNPQQQSQQPQQQQQQQQSQQRSTPQASSSSTTSNSISDEMRRIATDRQRRKDHIQWARIHGAALELGMLALGRVGESDNSGYAYAMGRAFSEMIARDAVWESDEVEWVAGICVLQAVIRTAMRGDRRQRDEYDELLRTYEGRWKEIKDEARQALVTEVLLAAKEDLASLEESMH